MHFLVHNDIRLRHFKPKAILFVFFFCFLIVFYKTTLRLKVDENPLMTHQ